MSALHHSKSITTSMKYLLLISFLLMAGITGCTKSNEKTFSGISADEIEMGYSATIKYNKEGEAIYSLKIKPNNPEKFIGQLNKKWHEEGKLKLNAYNNMKKYCEMTKEKSVCESLEEMSKEINSPKASLIYTINFFGQNGEVLENINFNHTYNLNDFLKNKLNSTDIQDVFKITRINFTNIAKMELKGKL